MRLSLEVFTDVNWKVLDNLLQLKTRHGAHRAMWITKAVRSSLWRTTQHASAVARRETAKMVGVAQKAIRGRFYRHLSNSTDSARIWVGTYSIALSWLGKAKQQAKGVKVGRKLFYRGAFLGRGKLEGRGVFIRYGSPHFDPTRYGKPRNPTPDTLVRAFGIPIQDEVEQVFAKHSGDFHKFFAKEVQRQLSQRGRLPWATGFEAKRRLK